MEQSSVAEIAPVMAEPEKSAYPQKQQNRRKKHKMSQSEQNAEMKQRETRPEHPRPKLTRPGSRVDTGDAVPMTEFYRPNPLEGDSIMDATARLLAPRRGGPITQRPASAQKAVNSGKKNRSFKQEIVPVSSAESAKEEKAVQSHPLKKKGKGHKSAEHSGKKQTKREKIHVRPQKGPQEAVRSGHTKDSTEQKSLMKPYYLTF